MNIVKQAETLCKPTNDFDAGAAMWQRGEDVPADASSEMLRGWRDAADWHQRQLEHDENTLARTASEELADELALMDAVVDAMRIGLVAPVVRLSEAQLREIEDERVGWEQSCQPWNW